MMQRNARILSVQRPGQTGRTALDVSRYGVFTVGRRRLLMP